MRLSESLLNNIELPDKKHFVLWDGKSLGLRVFPTGTKSWIFIYRFQGRFLKLTFGHYPDVSLENARLLIETFKLKIKAGIDPRLDYLKVSQLYKDNVKIPRYLLWKIYYNEELNNSERDYIENYIKKSPH